MEFFFFSFFMEFLNVQNQGTFPKVGRKEENKNRTSQSPLWCTAFCPDAFLPGCYMCCLGQVTPSLRCPLYSQDSIILFSTAQWTYPSGHTSWSFFRTQLLSHRSCQSLVHTLDTVLTGYVAVSPTKL